MSYKLNVVKVHQDICGALGLDANEVLAITIEFAGRSVPVVTVEFMPEQVGLEKVANVLKRYALREL